MRLSDVSFLASAFWRIALAAPLFWVGHLRYGNKIEKTETHRHITATMAAWIIFHEIISPIQILGGLLLIAGIYLSKRGSQN